MTDELKNINELVEEFHEIRNADFETDEAYDVGFDRREEIKVLLRETLKGFGPAQKDDALITRLEELQGDRYLLIKQASVDAIDRMQGVAKVYPRWKFRTIERLINEKTEENLAELRLYSKSRLDQGNANHADRFAPCAAAIKLGHDPDWNAIFDLLEAAETEHTAGALQILAEIATENEWYGIARYVRELPVSRDIRTTYPRSDSTEEKSKHFSNLTAAELAERLHDASRFHQKTREESLQEYFPGRFEESIRMSQHRRASLRTNVEMLASNDIDAIEAFLENLTPTFDPPAPKTGKQTKPFGPLDYIEATVMTAEKELDTTPYCVAWDAVRGELMVGFGCGLYAFDQRGAITWSPKLFERIKVPTMSGSATHVSIDAPPSGFYECELATREIPARLSLGPLCEGGSSLGDRAVWNREGSKVAYFNARAVVLHAEPYEKVYDARESLSIDETLGYDNSIGYIDMLTFSWWNNDSFFTTTRIHRVDPGPERTFLFTRYVDFGTPSRNGKLKIHFRHLTRFRDQLCGQIYESKDTHTELVLYKKEKSVRPKSFDWAPERSHSFGEILSLREEDGRLFVNATSGLFDWTEEEPERLCDSADDFVAFDGRVVAIVSGELQFLE